jgi:hypothetical protein
MAEGNQTATAEQAAAAKAAEEAAIKAMSLRERLAHIRDHSSGVAKEDIDMEYEKNGQWKKITIQGHTIGGVLAGIRPLLRDYRLLLTPHLIERTYSGNRCDVIVEFEWENIDNLNDTKKVRWAGADTDKGGKGFSKAGTNALKEHLKKLFLITDKQDAAEETERVDHETDEGLSRAAVEAQREENKKLYADKANLVRAAFKAAKSLKEVERLEREHKAWIKTTPDEMRNFFLEAIENRKAHFAPPVDAEDEKAAQREADRIAAEQSGDDEE